MEVESDWEFLIPIEKDDLLKRSGGYYYIEEVIELEEALKRLKDVYVAIFNNGAEALLEKFDIIFSILYNDDLSFKNLQKLYDNFFVKMLSSLNDYSEEARNFDSPSDKKRAVNVFSMAFYLIALYIKLYETKLTSKSDTCLAVPKRGKGAAKVSKVKGKPEEVWDWSNRKKSAFEIIYNILDQNLNKLWPKQVADELFVSTIGGFCYKVFENSEIILAKMKPLRDSVANIICTLVKKYNHGLHFVSRILKCLKNNENSSTAVSTTIYLMVTDYNCATVLPKVLKEFYDCVRDDDIQGLARQISAILTELADLGPNVYLISHSESMLYAFLTAEPYPVRNGALYAISEIITKCLTNNELKTTRDTMLTSLLSHVLDQSSYVRSKVLQLWAKLGKEHAIPKSMNIQVLEAAKGRINDKSCYVVKHAIELCTVLLKENQCFGKSNITNLKTILLEEQNNLKELESQKPLTAEEAWPKLELELVIELANLVSIEVEAEEMETDLIQVEHATNIIAASISIGTPDGYKTAYDVLKRSEILFPDSDEIRCNMSKENAIAYYLAVLKKIFLANSVAMPGVNYNSMAYAKQVNVVEYIEESIAFAELINEASNLIEEVLKGKSAIEVVEAVHFFTIAYQFEIPNAKKAIRSFLTLVKCNQINIEEAVLSAYEQLYLTSVQPSEKQRCNQIATRLIKLVKELDMNEKSSLEKLVVQWDSNHKLPKDFVNVLWEKFSTQNPDQKAALILLDMMAKNNLSIVVSNIPLIASIGFSNPKDFLMVSYACQILSKYGLKKKNDKYIRLKNDDEIFEKSVALLVDNFDDIKCQNYVPMSLAVINMIFKLCFKPELLADKIVQDIYNKINMDEMQCEEEVLKRLLLIYSDILFKKWHYLEKDVLNSLKVSHVTVPDEKDDDEIVYKSDNMEAENDSLLANIKTVSEELVVGNNTINAYLRDLIVNFCKKALNEPLGVGLQNAASSGLAKLMFLSQTFCEEQIQLYMTLMENSKVDSVRSNLILGMSDLLCRWPNTIEPWSFYIYSRLKDNAVSVRKNAVIVLAFLIRREMIKVKGQLSEVCLCLEDGDRSIQEQVQNLLIDLSQKGNVLYNVIPDILSKLSDPSRTDVSKETFEKVMKYVLSLIKKEKHFEQLIDKLLVRLRESTNENQWKQFGFCLSHLQYNEKSLKKVVECLPLLHERLMCDEVNTAILTILHNGNKSSKPNVKEISSEGLSKLEELMTFKDNEKTAIEDQIGDLPDDDDFIPRKKERKTPLKTRPVRKTRNTRK